MAARRSERTVTTTREARVTSRMADGEEATTAPKPGLGLGEAMGIVSFLLLLAAFLLVDRYLGLHYGEGLFFKP